MKLSPDQLLEALQATLKAASKARGQDVLRADGIHLRLHLHCDPGGRLSLEGPVNCTAHLNWQADAASGPSLTLETKD